MVNFYLVRHGESEANKKKIFQGHLDSELSELGLIQAEKIADRLKNYTFDRVYTSDLKRAKNTAEKILEHHDNDLIVDERLREINRGEWTGISKSLVDLNNLPGEWFEKRAPGGENVLELIDRLKKFLDDEDFSDVSNVLIVSHGGVTKGILSGLTGMSVHDLKEINTGNTCLIEIEALDGIGNGKVVLGPCTKHLD